MDSDRVKGQTQVQVRFTVTPETDQAFRLWRGNSAPTAVFYAMWQNFMELPVLERQARIDMQPKGAERTPLWAKIESVTLMKQQELSADSGDERQEVKVPAAKRGKRKPRQPRKTG